MDTFAEFKEKILARSRRNRLTRASRRPIEAVLIDNEPTVEALAAIEEGDE